jgi:hypothetical protein
LQYIAQAGETYADIAQRMYGDRSKAEAIAQLLVPFQDLVLTLQLRWARSWDISRQA